MCNTVGNFDFTGTIRKIESRQDIKDAVRVISKANQVVANKLGLTPENAPTHPAFITFESLKKQVSLDREFYLFSNESEPIGTVAIEKSPDQQGMYYIERLAVLPSMQKSGYGIQIMNFAFQKICDLGGSSASVAIINENIDLKRWYIKQGFRETGTKTFDHLPFTVCFMLKELC